jgi:inner membrane protease subunit 2
MAARWGWSAAAAGGGSPRLQFARQVTNYLIRYASWIPPLIWFNAYVAEVTFIRGPSMYPFLNPQYNESLRRDLCLVWKLYAQEDLRRGMVVTFRFVSCFSSPGGRLPSYWWYPALRCGAVVLTQEK